MADPENGGRFTVKKYHSQTTLTDATWHHDQIELLPMNPNYDLIPVAPSVPSVSSMGAPRNIDNNK